MAIRRCIHRGLRPSASPPAPLPPRPSPFTLKTLKTTLQSQPLPTLPFTQLRHRNNIGYSHGHLISAAAQEAHITNVFTGEDWCLFMDVNGKIHMARPKPGSWGGRSNCVHVAREDQTWEEMPLGADMAFHGRSFCKCPRSSLNVWVSPSTIL